ncbi:hypothetical protein AB0N23_16490 [Streptomyces sp. NPDC052644]
MSKVQTRMQSYALGTLYQGAVEKVDRGACQAQDGLTVCSYETEADLDGGDYTCP